MADMAGESAGAVVPGSGDGSAQAPAGQLPGSPPPADRPADSSPRAKVVKSSYVAVGVAAVVAAVVYVLLDPSLNLGSVEGLSIFAPFYVVAQAIERLLEPIAARVKVTTAEKAQVRQARQVQAALEVRAARGGAAATAAEADVATAAVETAEGALAQVRADRAIALWAAASVVSVLVCGIVGLGLLSAIAETRPSEFVRTVDVLLTGLAIGAGTKPLHDLITRIEKAKDNADPATKPATVTPAP